MRVKKMTKVFAKTADGSPKGIQCTFIRLNEKWACKFYHQEVIRNEAYDRQKAAHAIGLGPAVGGKDITVYSPHGRPYYGYITEVVKTVQCEWAWQWAENMKHEIGPIIKRLEKELNWEFTDHHGLNWGYNENGKLIPIDFG